MGPSRSAKTASSVQTQHSQAQAQAEAQRSTALMCVVLANVCCEWIQFMYIYNADKENRGFVWAFCAKWSRLRWCWICVHVRCIVSCICVEVRTYHSKSSCSA